MNRRVYIRLVSLLLQAGQILADTITVLDTTKTQHNIRLAGIDAPESKQAFGQASKKFQHDDRRSG